MFNSTPIYSNIQLLALFFLLILFTGKINAQDKAEKSGDVIVIDTLTKLPSGVFPFDVPFNISYKIDRNLSINNIQYMRVKTKNRDLVANKVNLYPLKYHVSPPEKKGQRKKLSIFMPPLPPGKLFDIVIIYDGHPKIIKAFEALSTHYGKLNNEQKEFVTNYIKLEDLLLDPGMPPSFNNMTEGMAGLLDFIQQIADNQYRTTSDEQLKKLQKLYKTYKINLDEEQQLLLSNCINELNKDNASFLLKIRSVFDLYRERRRTIMPFPRVRKIVDIFDKLDIEESQQEQNNKSSQQNSKSDSSQQKPGNEYFQKIQTFNNCCHILDSILSDDSVFLKKNLKTLVRLKELSEDEVTKILGGKLHFFSSRKESSLTKNITGRIANLDITHKVLWQLIEDLKSSSWCIDLKCNEVPIIGLIDNLSAVNAKVLGTMKELENRLDMFSILYFEWIGATSTAINYKTAVNNIIKSDLGVANIFASYEHAVRPYYGISVNLRSVKNYNLYRNVANTSDYFPKHFGNWLLYHMSFDLGVTIGSIAVPDRRDDLYQKSNILAGVSLRIPKTGIRVNGGVAFYEKIDHNPLIEDTNLAVLPYAGVKFDLTLKEAFGGVIPIFFR